jgi:hypothetical protein
MTTESPSFIGHTCAVPRLNGCRHWWVTIIGHSDCGKYVKVAAGVGFGKPRYVPLTDCMNISKKPRTR